jgi:hypothetical protein
MKSTVDNKKAEEKLLFACFSERKMVGLTTRPFSKTSFKRLPWCLSYRKTKNWERP